MKITYSNKQHISKTLISAWVEIASEGPLTLFFLTASSRMAFTLPWESSQWEDNNTNNITTISDNINVTKRWPGHIKEKLKLDVKVYFKITLKQSQIKPSPSLINFIWWCYLYLVNGKGTGSYTVFLFYWSINVFYTTCLIHALTPIQTSTFYFLQPNAFYWTLTFQMPTWGSLTFPKMLWHQNFVLKLPAFQLPDDQFNLLSYSHDHTRWFFKYYSTILLLIDFSVTDLLHHLTFLSIKSQPVSLENILMLPWQL